MLHECINFAKQFSIAVDGGRKNFGIKKTEEPINALKKRGGCKSKAERYRSKSRGNRCKGNRQNQRRRRKGEEKDRRGDR